MTTDLNDVKAGKYQLVAVSWDEITSKPGDPLDFVRHHRGDIVDLNAADAKRLVAAGAVVSPGQLEKAKAEEARALAERAAAEYAAILAGLPEDVRADLDPGTVPATGGDQGGSGSGSGSGSGVANIGDILNDVGDDKAKAQAALDAEKARGEDARPRLVTKLEAVLAADGGQGS